jgi:carboxylesterase type B
MTVTCRYQFNYLKVGSFADWMGVTHTGDRPFIFGRPLASWNAISYTENERQLSLQMVYYWTNFAKTG